MWVKAALGVTAFRAWSKGEQPEVRLCRLFFPARLDCLQDDRLIPLLLNSPQSNWQLGLQRRQLFLRLILCFGLCFDLGFGSSRSLGLGPTLISFPDP